MSGTPSLGSGPAPLLATPGWRTSSPAGASSTAKTADLDVRCYDLPGLHAASCVTAGLIGEGVAGSTRVDAEAKSLGKRQRARLRAHRRHTQGAAVTSTASNAVRYRSSAGVATLTMDQPHNRNAMTAALLDGLGDGLARASDEEGVRVVVLTHTGPAFCAGADLSATAQLSASGGGAPTPPRHDLAQVLAAIGDLAKPVVARISGHCMGGGVGLAAACDLSVAAAGARFGFTEVRVGVAPAIISVVCVPKLSCSDTLELFLTGEPVSAARAAEIGLVTRAVPDAELDAAVAEVVGQLLEGGPAALAATKRVVYDAMGWGRAAAFDAMSVLSRQLFESPEAAEGIAAFREKRPPSWSPRSAPGS